LSIFGYSFGGTVKLHHPGPPPINIPFLKVSVNIPLGKTLSFGLFFYMFYREAKGKTMQMSIKVDTGPALRYLRGIKDSQLPFAMAKGLTKTAQDVQTAMIRELPGRFTLRTKWYEKQTPYGFKIVAAKKQSPMAKVFTRAPWIVEFEAGTQRKPAGKTFAVPTPAVKRTKRELISKTWKPRAAMTRTSHRRAFILPTGQGAGMFYRAKKGAPLTMLYWLARKAIIRPRLKFAETGQRVANAKFTDNFIAAFRDAVRTAR